MCESQHVQIAITAICQSVTNSTASAACSYNDSIHCCVTSPEEQCVGWRRSEEAERPGPCTAQELCHTAIPARRPRVPRGDHQPARGPRRHSKPFTSTYARFGLPAALQSAWSCHCYAADVVPLHLQSMPLYPSAQPEGALDLCTHWRLVSWPALLTNMNLLL